MSLTKKFTVFAGALIFSLTLHASTDAEKAISAAEAAQKSASNVGYEWRDTSKMINQAKELAKAGKTQEAIKLARKAEEQGNDALAQYHTENKRVK